MLKAPETKAYLRKSPVGRDLVYAVLQRGATYDRSLWFGHNGAKVGGKLSDLDAIRVVPAGKVNVYAAQGESVEFIARASENLPPKFKHSKLNRELRKDLSHILVYSYNERTAQILGEYLGNAVRINDMDGVLIEEKGALYHIIAFVDRDSMSSGETVETEKVRKTEMPVAELKTKRRGGLSMRSAKAVHTSFSEGSEFELLKALLAEEKVTEVYVNLFGELD